MSSAVAEVRRAKALAQVLELAKITDSRGEAVDLSSLDRDELISGDDLDEDDYDDGDDSAALDEDD